jgi:hypothetical protein
MMSLGGSDRLDMPVLPIRSAAPPAAHITVSGLVIKAFVGIANEREPPDKFSSVWTRISGSHPRMTYWTNCSLDLANEG